ncbi:MAG TPA: lytic transglycosylase domain-containing protein, partial [Polyangiaceae bacterium]|nr:lytic transglycosylase domain-containing protein [Polyangiaceae bacterium]
MGTREKAAVAELALAKAVLGLFVVLAGCSRQPPTCVARSTTETPSSSASAEVAKILAVELSPEDAGDAAEGEAFVELVRRDAWQEAAQSIDLLPEEKKKKPTARLVRARVAMALGDYATAVQALTGLEKDLAPITEDIERWRAEAAATAGPFQDAAQFFLKQGGAKGLGRA